MARIQPLTPEEIPEELKPLYEGSLEMMGFVANDVLTVAKRPDIFKGLFALGSAVYGPGQVDLGLKRMVGEVTSKAAGCMYCTAHTAHGAAKMGIPQEKLDDIWAFETSEHFSDAERAALNFAMLAGRSPSEVSDADFERLREFYNDQQIIEITSVIGLFGFLNRWNDTMATTLEDAPLTYAKENLKEAVWSAGKHERE